MKRLAFLACVVCAAVIPMASMADSWTDLRAAIYYKNAAEVVRLLDSGVDVNIQNEEGWTPLHVAAEQGDLRMVQYLLARGADPNLTTARGRTAFDVSEGYGEVRALLRSRMGAAVDPLAPYLNGQGGQGATGGAGQGEGENAGDPPTAGPRPATGAGERSRNGPNDGRTASTRARLEARDAVWYNNQAELEMILDAGLDVNALDETGRETLLHAAAWRDRIDIARMLLARGADPSIRDKDGKRPLDYAQSPEMRMLLGGSAQAPAPRQTPANGSGDDHCRRMWNEARALCSISDTSCNTSAHIRYQACQQRGTWY